MLTIRQATPADINDLLPKIREADKREIVAATGNTAACELQKAFEREGRKYAALAPCGEIIALFGIAQTRGLSRIGSPWLIASDTIMQHKREFLKTSKAFFPQLREGYHILINMVDARNKLSIKWLGWLGFTVKNVKPYGPFDMPFHEFEWSHIDDIPDNF